MSTKIKSIREGVPQEPEAWAAAPFGPGDNFAKLDGRWFSVNGTPEAVTEIRWEAHTFAQLVQLEAKATVTR